jgi:hypothetical protein
VGLYLLTRTTWTPIMRWRLSLITMLTLGTHVGFMGLCRGLNINKSHAYLPPMWLLCLIGIVLGLSWLLRSKPAAGQGQENEPITAEKLKPAAVAAHPWWCLNRRLTPSCCYRTDITASSLQLQFTGSETSQFDAAKDKSLIFGDFPPSPAAGMTVATLFTVSPIVPIRRGPCRQC